MSRDIKKYVFALLLVVGGCGYDNTSLQAQENTIGGGGNGSSGVLDFAAVKANIFSTQCAGCHTGGGARGGVTLDTYDATKAKLNLIWSAVSRGQMPPSGSMSPTLLAQLKQWIDEGAIESAAGAPPPVEVVDFARIKNEIFLTKCAGCHTEGGARGGVSLESYASVQPKVKSIWKEASKGSMPLAGPLDPSLVALLKKWVDAGAPEKVDPTLQAISVSVPQVECTDDYREKISNATFINLDDQLFFDNTDQSLKRHPEGCDL